MNSPSREVATRKPDPSVNITGELATLGDVWSVSEVLALSDLVPAALYGHPAAIFQVIVTGQRLGLHWTEAIRVIYSPGKGQIGMMSQFLLAQLRKAGHRYSISYSDDDGGTCTFTLIRRDEPDNPYVGTFSMKDAAKAKLTTRDNWVKYERQMLRARAVTDGVSFGAPEMVLGFVIEGDEFSVQPVELHPQAPAPPEPGTGQAATGEDQAAQAEQLREMDQRYGGTGGDTILRASGGAGGAARDAVITQSGTANPAVSRTLRPEVYEDITGKRWTPEPVADPLVGGIPESEPAADSDVGGTSEAELVVELSSPEVPEIDPRVREIFDETIAEHPAPPTGEAQGPDTTPPMDRELAGGDAAARAKEKTLSEWFTTMGYDPKRYRAIVLHACSVYVRRRITGIRDMRAAEVMGLSSELSALHRRTDELAPVSRLADQLSTWEQAWREADPKGYAEYEEGK